MSDTPENYTSPEEVAAAKAAMEASVEGVNIPEHWENTDKVEGSKRKRIHSDPDMPKVISEATKDSGVDYGWTGNINNYVDPFFVSNMDFGSFDHYYPFAQDIIAAIQFAKYNNSEHPDTLKANGERVMDSVKVSMALHNFFATVKPNAYAGGCAMVYQGYKGDCPVTYIRFEGDHKNPMTFCLRADSYEYFINSWFDGIKSEPRQQNAIDWCREENNTPELQACGMRRRITQLSREWPLSWIRQCEPTHYFDGLYNGDFKLIEDTIAKFQARFDRYIGLATSLGEKLATKVRFRDHNLVLVFKGNKELDGIIVSLDKVPAKLENGEYHLGESPINLEDWHKDGNSVVVLVRKIKKMQDWINQLIKECKSEIPYEHPYAKLEFDKALKERLLASSHLIKELYQMNPSDVKGYVEKVANDMVGALNNHGGNIGLDLNTWKVYQYQEDGMPPVPVVVDPLNFRRDIYDVHTDRFMEILYMYMINLKSPYIRPYTHKVVADPNDGIQIGSIRHVPNTDPVKDVVEEEPASKDETDK